MTYFTKRLALAQVTFTRIQWLLMHSKSLLLYIIRRLANSVLLPIIVYSAEILEPTVTIMRKMQTFLN